VAYSRLRETHNHLIHLSNKYFIRIFINRQVEIWRLRRSAQTHPRKAWYNYVVFQLDQLGNQGGVFIGAGSKARIQEDGPANFFAWLKDRIQTPRHALVLKIRLSIYAKLEPRRLNVILLRINASIKTKIQPFVHGNASTRMLGIGNLQKELAYPDNERSAAHFTS
jgi:hypothetical protein